MPEKDAMLQSATQEITFGPFSILSEKAQDRLIQLLCAVQKSSYEAGVESVKGKETDGQPLNPDVAQYAQVWDKRVPCLTHGGTRPRGNHAVHVHGVEVWQESDAFQTAEMAKERCLKLAELLQRAYEDGLRGA